MRQLPLKPIPASADVFGMDLNSLLRTAVDRGASDVHLKAGRPPVVRLDGALQALDGWEPLGPEQLERFLRDVCGSAPARLAAFEESGEFDTAYQPAGPAAVPRQRLPAARRHLVRLPGDPERRSDLRFAEDLRRACGTSRKRTAGLILVTGATGVGKTTTLASMLGHINRTRRQHIVTIEDPIEILHSDEGCIVNQREVGLDTESFNEALRRVLRQDPDVILIGELRDSETAETALQAAESGHLVLSTMHTLDAAETVGRFVEFFPAVKHAQVRSILAGVLRGIVSQRLLPRIDGGRVAAFEVMVANNRIADLIRENRPEEITEAIADGEFFHMQTLTAALIDLVLTGEVDREVAAGAAPNHHDFVIALEHALKVQASGGDTPDFADELPRLRLAGGAELSGAA